MVNKKKFTSFGQPTTPIIGANADVILLPQSAQEINQSWWPTEACVIVCLVHDPLSATSNVMCKAVSYNISNAMDYPTVVMQSTMQDTQNGRCKQHKPYDAVQQATVVTTVTSLRYRSFRPRIVGITLHLPKMRKRTEVY